MTVNQVGSFVLAVMSLVGSYHIGNKRVGVWLYMFFVQLAWMAFGYVTHQYGFILCGVGFAGVNVRNYRKWRREAGSPPKRPSCANCSGRGAHDD